MFISFSHSSWPRFWPVQKKKNKFLFLWTPHFTTTSCLKLSPNIPLFHHYLWLTFLINSALCLVFLIFSASALTSLYISTTRLHLFPAVTSHSCTSFLCCFCFSFHRFKFFLSLCSYERAVLCSRVDCFAGVFGPGSYQTKTSIGLMQPLKMPDCGTWLF